MWGKLKETSDSSSIEVARDYEDATEDNLIPYMDAGLAMAALALVAGFAATVFAVIHGVDEIREKVPVANLSKVLTLAGVGATLMFLLIMMVVVGIGFPKGNTDDCKEDPDVQASPEIAALCEDIWGEFWGESDAAANIAFFGNVSVNVKATPGVGYIMAIVTSVLYVALAIWAVIYTPEK